MTQSPPPPAVTTTNTNMHDQRPYEQGDIQVPHSLGMVAVNGAEVPLGLALPLAQVPNLDNSRGTTMIRHANAGSGSDSELEGWVKKEQSQRAAGWDITKIESLLSTRAPAKRKFTSLEIPPEQHRQPPNEQQQQQPQQQHDRDLQEPNWDLLDYVPLQNFDMNSHHHQNPHPQYYAAPPPSVSTSTTEDAAFHHFQTQPHPSPTYPFSPSASTSPYSQQLPPQNFASPGGNPYEALTVQEAELKRLRNTAASARFRAKKKQREASLERNAREKREQLEKLEERIAQLEKENQWLRELILRKGDRIEEGKKKGEERKDGVGTETEAKE